MPFDPVLTLETAALMLVAFLLGATIGSLLHVAVLRLRAAPATAAMAAAMPEVSAAEALVAAPIIAPLVVPRDPVMPTEIPVPDFTTEAAAEPALPELAPARKPGVATHGRDVGRHDRAVPPVEPEIRAVPRSEEEAPRIEPEIVAVSEPPPEPSPPPVPEAETPADLAAPSGSVEQPHAEETSAALPPIDVTAELLALTPTPEVAEVEVLRADPAPSAIDADEVAAMRAIEGSWTPGRRMLPVEPPVEPQFEPVAAAPSGADAGPLAVRVEALEPEVLAERAEVPPVATVADDEAANVATADALPLAEVPDVLPQHEEDRIVPAESSEDSEPEPHLEPELEPEPERGAILPSPTAQDQPPGLGAPRYGMRDDLTQIVGVLPVVETTLNRIGVYHFDQVADWSDAHAGWVEAHLGIAGRVEREHWREQARELAAIASGKRPSRKKRPS